MSLKLNLEPTSVIEAKLGIQPNGPVRKYFTKRAADYMDKYVPYSGGNLAYTTRQIGNEEVIYNAEYAHYMYEGKVYGPNIPFIDEGGNVYFRSPKKKQKHDTGRELKYKQSAGHEYAGPHWDKRMVSAEMDDLVKEVQNYINNGGKE